MWSAALLVFVSDTGGPASRLGIAVLERLLHAPPMRLAGREDVARLRDRHSGGNALVVLEAPEAEIVSAANRSGRPILRFRESLDASVHDLRAVHHVGFVEALRHATKLHACAAGLRARPIMAEEGAIRAALALPDREIPEPGEDLVPFGPGAPLTPLEAAMLVSVGRAPPVWPAALFLQADAPGDPVVAPLELSGPARLLGYGPYLHLAAGRWVAHARCIVSGNHSGNRLRLEMLAGGAVLAGTAIALPAEGAVEVAVAFEVTEPRHSLELYWRLLEGAIEGALLISEVRLNGDGS